MSILQDKYMQINLIRSFIEQVGIPVTEGKVIDGSFLPGIEIANGGLIYDPEKLTYPGDMLHEAGHIAVMPNSVRHKATGNLKEQNISTDGEEIAAILWSYAACLHIGLPPEAVFHPEGYKGESEWLLKQFSEGIYIGLPLLQWMGLCAPDGTEPGYPAMLKWLRN